jgi:hypothetical protein
VRTFYSSCSFRQDGYGVYFYLRTSRLDLDDYNKEVEEGCTHQWQELDEYCRRLYGMNVKQ